MLDLAFQELFPRVVEVYFEVARQENELRLIELQKEDFEIAIYPLDPHGFVHPDSWLDEYRRIFKLFETNLK